MSQLEDRTTAHDDSTWALPYGDLMSLLLAVFVMIAAMSDVRKGKAFEAVRGSVREALGFRDGADGQAASAGGRPLTLVERLERMGVIGSAAVPVGGFEETLRSACEVDTTPDRVTIRVAGPVAFSRFSGALRPEARPVLVQIAAVLQGGEAQIEVRGLAGDGTLPEESPFRDPIDLSYARARAVADALVDAGVMTERLRVTAAGDGDPVVAGPPQRAPEGANRRVEIIVHAVRSAAVAGKEQHRDG